MAALEDEASNFRLASKPKRRCLAKQILNVRQYSTGCAPRFGYEVAYVAVEIETFCQTVVRLGESVAIRESFPLHAAWCGRNLNVVYAKEMMPPETAERWDLVRSFVFDVGTATLCAVVLILSVLIIRGVGRFVTAQADLPRLPMIIRWLEYFVAGLGTIVFAAVAVRGVLLLLRHLSE